jgi:hypothetical protein
MILSKCVCFVCRQNIFAIQGIMENLRVIRVKVVAPEKPLDVNTFKNNADVDLTIWVVPKYLSVDMASCNIQK